MYFKSFWEEIKTNPTITGINVFGYSVALSACLLIALFAYNQVTFDRFNQKSGQIYRLNYFQTEKSTYNSTTNHHWYEVLPKEIPGIEKVARYGWPRESVIEWDKKQFKANGLPGDKELFDIFTFPILEREQENFFEKPSSIAISKSLALKIFGTESPIGKSITFNYRDSYRITAVFEDIPHNSSLKFDYLISANDVLEGFGEEMKNHWLWWMWRTFVLVRDESVAAEFTTNMKPLQEKYVGKWYAETSDYYLQPLEQIHTKSSSISGSFDSDVSIKLIYIFCSVGVLILIISCINYINLSIAGFEARKKSVTIKKIIGAGRKYLFKRYISNSILLTFLCIIIAVLISLNIIPILRKQAISGLEIPLLNPFFWLILLLFGTFIGMLSGLYPANSISKITLAENIKTVKSKSLLSSLIILQFSIAIILLISVITIRKQLTESIRGDLGYNYSSLINFWSTESTFKHFDAFNGELKKVPGVISTTSCSFELPGYVGNYWPVQPTGSTSKLEIFHISVAPDFFEVLQIPMKIKIGKLSEDTATASDRAVINSEAMRQFGMEESILGKLYNMGETKVEIVGIVNDFHVGSMRDLIKPIQFTMINKGWNHIVRIEKTNYDKTIALIEKTWSKFETLVPFQYKFIDAQIAQQYIKENSLLKLFNLFFVLAMVLSLVGLYGIVQLLLNFRIKEIGIRKVNGARTWEVMSMLNASFIKWIIISFIIAVPVAWFIMYKWLQNFAYKTTLSWWLFVLAGVITFVIAITMVSWQSWRVSRRNPVESLRYE